MTQRATHRPTAPLPTGLRAVEASAGTGKTYSITTTVLRLVLERDLDLDALLVVTFTRAATAELVDRVRRRLAEAAAVLTGGDSDDTVLVEVLELGVAASGSRREALDRVERALQQVDEAQVTTIHGFCQRVLQQAVLAADTDPDLQVDGDREQRDLLARVVDDWLVARTRDAHPAYASALQHLGLERAGLHAIAATVTGEPVPHVEPQAEPVDAQAVLLAAWQRLRDALDDLLDDLHAWSEQALADKQFTRAGVLSPDKVGGRAAPLLDAVRAGRCPPLGCLELLCSEGVAEKCREAYAPPRLAAAVDELLEALVVVERDVRLRLAAHVVEEVPAQRLAAGRIGFSDVLRLLHLALDDDGAAARLRHEVGGGVRAVLVDEFQDTDPVQWRILTGIFDDVELFEVVGDPKQAIYGWRGADLETYLRALHRAEDEAGVVTMTTNWRSDGPYVAACNHLLDRERTFGHPEIRYLPVSTPEHHAGARLHAADGTPLSGVELVLHTRGEGAQVLTIGDAEPRVAAHVAEEVASALTSGWTVPTGEPPAGGPPDGTRPVRAGDCAVLVRSNRQADLVADELRRRGLAAVVGGGRDVLAGEEAGMVADLLAALLEPGRERLLRRVLVGPFGGLDGPALQDLDEQGWEQQATRLQGWARTWHDRGVAALLEAAVREGGAELRAAALRDGDRQLANLRHLAELLDSAERDEALGTHALLAWLRARRAEGTTDGRPAEERELRIERDDDAVRVMTVHASKGLEFPLVWAPFLWGAATRTEKRNTRTKPFVVNDPQHDHRRTVVLHPARVRDGDERKRLRRLADAEEWRESLRLAYVALTRAVHRCVVHVGAMTGVTASPAWHLLLAEHGSFDPTTDDPQDASVDDAALRTTLRAVAEGSQGTVTLRVAQDHDPGRTEAARTTEGQRGGLEALQWTRHEGLDRAWGRSSFTQLLSRRTAPDAADAHDADAADHDREVPDDSVATTPPVAVVGDAEAGVEDLGPEVPLAQVPRGARWGVLLHAVYEHLPSFDADVAQVREVLVDQLRGQDDALHGTALDRAAAGLHATLRTPLGSDLGNLRLADVARRDRLDELRFTLALAAPERPVDVGALADVFDAAADRHPEVPLTAAAAHLRAGGSGHPVHGLLVGAIDLVLREHTTGGPRWWIADYKSNGLGAWVDEPGGGRSWDERVGHHRPDHVLDAMVHGDYLLQAHLYVVALHRWLGARLGDAYDYEQHVGGWAYLFVRGMTGPDVRRDDDGRPHGVATGRPDRAMVEALDDVLTGRIR